MGPLFGSVFNCYETFDNSIITSLFSSTWTSPLNGQSTFLTLYVVLDFRL